MIVVNKKPNITHLPYTQDGRKDVFSFKPGQNEVAPEVFSAVCEQIGEKRWKTHYSSFLKPIGGLEPQGAAVDITTLSADDAVDLAAGTMEMARLDAYAAAESSRKAGARKTVLAAIDKQRAEIEAIEKAKAEKK